jgi:PleD family two-component response regulator
MICLTNDESSSQGGSGHATPDRDKERSPHVREAVAPKTKSSPPASNKSDSDDSNASGSDYENECACKPLLVVDDNDFNLFTFKQVLKDNFNLEALGAANGLEAVNIVKESLECCPFRAIFMDCSMPIMDGYEATREINKLFEQFWKN